MGTHHRGFPLSPWTCRPTSLWGCGGGTGWGAAVARGRPSATAGAGPGAGHESHLWGAEFEPYLQRAVSLRGVLFVEAAAGRCGGRRPRGLRSECGPAAVRTLLSAFS